MNASKFHERFLIKTPDEYINDKTKEYEFRLKLGVSIRLMREGVGVSQNQVCKVIGSYQGNYSKVERGEKGLTHPEYKGIIDTIWNESGTIEAVNRFNNSYKTR